MWINVNWIYLPQNRIQWQATINTEMKLRVPYKEWTFLTS